MESAVAATEVLSPLSGRVVALADVPDPVFAGGMVGVGVAVDPLRAATTAVAPVSGKLLKLMPHAFIVLTAGGVGVLVHLGLDTVALGGQGFEALAAEGDEVSAGAGIIGFDVVAVEAAGASPITPVVLLDERDATRLSIRDVTEITLGAALFTVDG